MQVCQGHLPTDGPDLTKLFYHVSDVNRTITRNTLRLLPTRRWSPIPVLSGHDAHWWTSGVSHDVRTVVLAIVFTVWATLKMSMMMMMMSLGT